MTDNDKTAYQAELLFNRLLKRYKHLKKWARRIGTNAFRLYDRDIPEIPLVLDIYGDAVSGAFYRRHAGVDDQRPGEAETATSAWLDAWLSAMKAATAKALDIEENLIFLKERQRMRRRQETGEQYGRIAESNVYRDVIEGELRYRVNLSDYLDTGLFLDARKKRALIRNEAAGKRFLNLFAYTCSLSVSAAKGGASRIDSVDLSKTYLEWGKINFALNRLEAPGDFIRSDVLQFLDHAEKKKERWDLIALDPPSFSNSKKMLSQRTHRAKFQEQTKETRSTTTIDIKRDHHELIQRCLSILEPGGTLVFSSNARGLSLDAGDFPGIIVKDIGKSLVDEDFRGKRTPCCYGLTL